MEHSQGSKAAEWRERIGAAAGCGGGLHEHAGITARLRRAEGYLRVDQREVDICQRHRDWSEPGADPDLRLVRVDCEAAVCGVALYLRPHCRQLGLVDPDPDLAAE